MSQNRDKIVRKILTATSLSPLSDAVVEAGARLAAATGAEHHLLHAFALPFAYFAAPSGLTTIDPDFLEREKQRAEILLEQQLERLEMRQEDFAGILVASGAPHRLLLDEAAELPADLLVVGARDSSEPRGLGSTADRIVRKAHCAVLVVGGSFAIQPERILAPTDLSPFSRDCLERGLAILGEIEGADQGTLDVLFVLSPDERQGSKQFTAEAVDRLAQEELERWIASLALPPGRRVLPEVRVGEPREEILRELRETPTDLVVIGTHGRGGLERLLVGSVAIDVLREAPSSVLILPPEPGALAT